MSPRCRSVFETYQHFQAWQDVSQSNSPNLLQRLNTNLNTYQTKYKKYMNFQQNQLKISKKLQSFLPSLEKHQENIPILPIIKPETQSISKSPNLVTPKVFISGQKQIKDSDIFCERTNLLLKHKTLWFEKTSKQINPSNRRKLSLLDQKSPEIQKILTQSKNHADQEQQNFVNTVFKMDPLKNISEGYKKLRCRLKKAANKGKMYREQKNDQLKDKQNNVNFFLKRKPKKMREFAQKNIDCLIEQKINEFSDKRFFESNIKVRYNLQR